MTASPPLKILFVSRACRLDGGGMERFSYDLIQAATKHPCLSIKTICHRGSRRTSPLFAIVVIPRVLQQARHFDVIHLGDPMLSLAGWLVKTLLHKRVAVTVHGLDITYQNWLYQRYLRLFFRDFAYYFPISQSVSEHLTDFAVSGHTQVINPPLTTDFFSATAKRSDLAALLSRRSIVLDKKNVPPVYLLTSGRLVTRKGHSWFIDQVMPSLPAHVHYLIAGTGPQERIIRDAIARHQLEPRVHLLGRVSEADLRILYNTADAFIQPNIDVPGDIEGFGLVLLEAAACKLPIFASALQGITDAVIPPHNGLLLDPGSKAQWQQALQTFLAAPSTNKRSLIRDFTVQRFTWSNYLQRFLSTLSVSTPNRR